jgi:natural product precursor
MKQLKQMQLKLNRISDYELKERELSHLHGGNYCAYSSANNSANTSAGLCSTGANGEPASFMKDTTGWGPYC